MTFPLHGCRAIITGASSGLGAEFARQLAPQAAALLLVARRPEALEAVRAECLARHPELRIEVCAADLAEAAGRETLRAQVAAGDWNLLVNNAGMGDYGSVATADPAKLKLMIDLNVTAPVLLVNSLLPSLARPAAILNVSSLAGEVPLPEAACYAASKAFVTRFSEALRMELAGQGVTVSCVCPGPTPTAFSRTARRPGGGDTDRSGQDLLRQPPEHVVAVGLRALATNRACVYPGLGVGLAARLFRHLPRVLLRPLLQRRLERGRLCDTPAP
jgi:short-subunit dehydrogenase